MAALCHDECDVVVLIIWVQATNFTGNCFQCGLAWQIAISAQSIYQRALSKLLPGFVIGFGDAVCVEGQRVSRQERALADGAVPFLEEAEQRGGGVKALEGAIGAQDESRQVSAVGVAEALGIVIVFGKEERGVGAVYRVLKEQAVHGPEQELGMIQSKGALAAEVGLQVRHEKSSSYAFAGDVADDEAEPPLADIEEVEIIASHLASGKAQARVFESLGRGMDLRKQARLYLLGDSNS
jgi:hypothetical protein